MRNCFVKTVHSGPYVMNEQSDLSLFGPLPVGWRLNGSPDCICSGVGEVHSSSPSQTQPDGSLRLTGNLAPFRLPQNLTTIWE